MMKDLPTPEPQSIEEVKAATEKECARLQAGWLASEKTIHTLSVKVIHLEKIIEESTRRLQRIEQSRSWRWTSFFRKTEWYLRQYFSSKKE